MNEDKRRLVDMDDLAPDADEPGDTKLPTGLESYKHEGGITKDEVDQKPETVK